MIKELLLLLLLLTGFIALNGQSYFNLNGTIEDSLGVGVSYSTLVITSSGRGYYSDVDGGFEIPNISLGDTLLIQAIGYDNYILPVISKDSVKIKLVQTSYELSEINVSGSNDVSSSKVVLGNFSKKSKGEMRGSPGLTIVTKVDNRYGQNGYIVSVKFWADFLRKCDGLIRIRAYAVSPNGSPGQEITRDNSIIMLKGSRKVHEIDISEQFIELPKGGAFIGIEFVKQKEGCRVDKLTGSRFVGIGYNYDSNGYKTYISRLAKKWSIFTSPFSNDRGGEANLNLNATVKFLHSN